MTTSSFIFTLFKAWVDFIGDNCKYFWTQYKWFCLKVKKFNMVRSHPWTKNLFVSKFCHATKRFKILRISNFVQLLVGYLQFCDFSLNKSWKTYPGVISLPSTKNWQLIYSQWNVTNLSEEIQFWILKKQLKLE